MLLLDAVNIVLRAVGEGRVQDVNSTHPSVITAKELITESQALILAKGLWFNNEYNVTLPKDVNGFVFVPLGTISITSFIAGYELLLRGTRLYDPTNNTYDLSALPDVTINYISNPNFDDIPVLAQQAIAYRAASEFIADDDGDDVKYKRANTRAQQSAITLATEDMKQRRFNAMNSPTTSRVRSGMHGASGSVMSGDTIGGR
jgi:hypothetical protein